MLNNTKDNKSQATDMLILNKISIYLITIKASLAIEYVTS